MVPFPRNSTGGTSAQPWFVRSHCAHGTVPLLLPRMTGHAPHHHPPPPSARMLSAMDSVKAACEIDVLFLCPMPSDFPLARSDSVLEFALSPLAPPPLIVDSQFLDDMLNSVLRMAADQPMDTSWTVIYDSRDEHREPKQLKLANDVISSAQVAATPENFLDSVVSSLADKQKEATAETWDPVDFSKRLVEHGDALLKERDLPEQKRRLARRLSETTPDRFKGPRLPLPFSCPKSRCLMDAYEQGAVSNSCSDALKAAEQVRETESSTVSFMVAHQVPESATFLGFSLLCTFLLVSALFLTLRQGAHFHHGAMQQRRLNKKILQAVYSNPELKTSIEFQLQEEIGAVPPLPPHVLATMGGTKPPKAVICCTKAISMAFFPVMFVVFFVNPVLAVLSLCVAMTVRFLMWGVCPNPPVLMCKCCCCGVTTEDVKNDTVSAEQACCTCCNGLGVCGPLCMSCCGADPDDACDCCTGDCDCCNPEPECTCCCCGLTNWNAKKGIMTDEQSCCTCCNATGQCADGCAACCEGGSGCACCSEGCDCCSGESSPNGKKAKVFIYQGIPVQMV